MHELFDFFTSCLQHGEWQLAAACVPELITLGGHAHKLLHLIQAIIRRPYSSAWELVGSPHKLAWFWLQVLEKWSQEQVSPNIRKELEFLLLLEDLRSEEIADSHLQELHQVFVEPQSAEASRWSCVELCLQTLLEKKQASLARWLAHFLELRPPAQRPSALLNLPEHVPVLQAEHSALQHIFIQHLMKKLQKPQWSPERAEAWLNEVYGVLAALPPPRPAGGGGHFEALCEALWTATEGELREEGLLVALLRPRCHALLTGYCSTALRLQREHLLRSAPDTQELLPEAEQLFLSVCLHRDRPSAWKSVYFECLSSGKHFLEQVLVTALDLIQHQEFGLLTDLLQSEFRPLSRLLLLLGWTRCQSLSAAQALLRILHLQQAPANDSVLQEFADVLSSQLRVLEWCKNNNLRVSMEALLSQLHTLDSHSSLYILHSLSSLAEFEERRILDLLQQHSAGADSEVVCSVSAAEQRNLVLFQGFCAMKYAVYALCVGAHQNSGCESDQPLQQQQFPAAESDQYRTSASSEDSDLQFQHFLSECQLYLEAVPAMFRLELLENIFSLLFLSTADFAPQKEAFGLSEAVGARGGAEHNTWKRCMATAPPPATRCHHLDVGHLIQGCQGFLVDIKAMEGFLKLLKEGLEGMCVVGQQEGQEAGRALPREAEVAELLGCSVTADSFGPRLQRLSKRTAEAQWRLQIISSNQGENQLRSNAPVRPVAPPPDSRSSSLRRRKRAGRHTEDTYTRSDRHSGDTGTSDGVGGPCMEQEACPCGSSHSWLVPAMLAPPESLLLSCIRRGNFMEAHQVCLVFDLEAAACGGELFFMERYREVLEELSQVEQKMETQSMSSSSSSSEGLGSLPGAARSRLGSSGRSTLQAIGSAAAAGVAFYSISDIADRLVSTPARMMPSLQEEFWLSRCSPEPSGLLLALLEELSPASMAAFDLACCHCQLWRTSRQLLDTAERRLSTSLEARGIRVDMKVPHPERIHGYPTVLQQINKILNHCSKTSVKADVMGDDQLFSSPFGCCIQEVLLCCHPTLSQESIAARLSLVQRLENTLNVLSSATEGAETSVGVSLLSLLQDQASLKPADLDLHPVRCSMKQLLRSLDQLCPFEPDRSPARPDYVRSFLDYVNTLASVLVRSLMSEESCELRFGNPLLVVLQTPDQLLYHLLFDRQVPPERVLCLLQQERLRVSVQQVIVQRCCEALPLWAEPDACQTLSAVMHQHAASLGMAEGEVGAESEVSVEDGSVSPSNLSDLPPAQSTSAPPSFLLTPSALSFLKSRSPLLATLVCLSACKGEAARPPPSGWSGYFRATRKEAVLVEEQIAHEADSLLKEFPVLRRYLHAMAEPVLGRALGEDAAGLGLLVCGKPVISLMLSGPQGEEPRAAAAAAFQHALACRDLRRALSLLELYGGRHDGVLRDRLLACAALQGEDEGIGSLFRVQDADLRGRMALQTVERWPLASCLELLEFCLNDEGTELALRTDLQQKKRELDIYHHMLELQPPLPWATWQELQMQSKTNSESMLTLMLEAKEFALCDQWMALYPVSEHLRLQLQTEHLLHLLEHGQTEESFKLLENFSTSMMGLDVCERALDRRPGLAACHFLSDYLTLHFNQEVSLARRQHIHALHLGSKVLMTLPPAARQEYFLLLSEPLVMLEQLLMNLKVDWAEAAVRALRHLLAGQEEAGVSADYVDTLLEEYARKALDFSSAPKEFTRSDSVISLQDALSQCPALDSASLDSPTQSSSSTPTHTPSSNSGSRERDRSSAGRRRRLQAGFQPPEQPPARRDWIPDTQQLVCMVCRRERFTMFNRRHHCRRCGRLVCHACSERKMSVDGCLGDDVRVCDQCYAYFHPESDEELEPAEVAGSPPLTDGIVEGMLHLPEVVQRQIRLGTDQQENQLLRSEFYYEQAPSAFLCVSLLSLHSDQAACGHQLVSHCRSLSRRLNHPEVDACLLADIMRQLLFSAKLMFVKVGRNQDLALCDSYISKVDVLKILISANYKYVPSLDDILETSAVARLRNQLLEAEHYQLAVEVSTKSGLDPAGVWQAWGLASLKAGNLSAAREKFARCLKIPVDRNQLSLGPPLLQEIIIHLETTVRRPQAAGEDILVSLQELEEALKEAGPAERVDVHQECLYYLQTYGTQLALVSFYMRQECVTEAVMHLLSQDCPDEVFLEGVLQPSMERGRLGMLQGVLEKLDPGLESCGRYLMASCQFLQRRSFFHMLYQLQQFMTDHVRAAMTCIRFFTHGAASYLQLGQQQRWLVRAKEHLRTYLQEQQSRSAGRRKSQLSSFRKSMTSSDVSRHMNTIELQLEVTRFLHRCEAAAPAPPPGTPTTPPTLFGGSTTKVEVACKVMLGGKNIEEGFGIAYRVIQDFQLEAQAVYTRAAQRLVRQRQYGAVRQLLKCVSESGSGTKAECDALILSCVSMADKAPPDAKELESLILETKSTESKIKAYLLCSKLRPAYLLAVKLEASRSAPLVQDVLQAAEGSQDAVMQNICRQWLSEHHDKVSQRHSRANAR